LVLGVKRECEEKRENRDDRERRADMGRSVLRPDIEEALRRTERYCLQWTPGGASPAPTN
jgi:hypothetical protein